MEVYSLCLLELGGCSGFFRLKISSIRKILTFRATGILIKTFINFSKLKIIEFAAQEGIRQSFFMSWSDVLQADINRDYCRVWYKQKASLLLCHPCCHHSGSSGQV